MAQRRWSNWSTNEGLGYGDVYEFAMLQGYCEAREDQSTSWRVRPSF